MNLFDFLSLIITMVLSFFISYVVAKIQAKNEIKKTLLVMSHENTKTLHTAFSALMTAIDEYYFVNCHEYKQNVIKAVSDFASIAPNEFQALLIDLNNMIDSYDKTQLKALKDEIFELYLHHIKSSGNNAHNKACRQE